MVFLKRHSISRWRAVREAVDRLRFFRILLKLDGEDAADPGARLAFGIKSVTDGAAALMISTTRHPQIPGSEIYSKLSKQSCRQKIIKWLPSITMLFSKWAV